MIDIIEWSHTNNDIDVIVSKCGALLTLVIILH